MNLTIDNYDGVGPRDYTSALEFEQMPRIKRQLNRPTQLRAWLIATGAEFVVPVAGGRMVVSLASDTKLFTGYISVDPRYEYLGWGEAGPVYRYAIVALSDEWLLDSKTLPRRAAFVNRTAGAILKQMAADLVPLAFDPSGVQDVATLPFYSAYSQKTWSEHAAQVALQSRASYRVHDGALHLDPIGTVEHTLDEADASFCPERLQLTASGPWANDATLTGRLEPRAYIKDYFLGDGFSLRFFLSNAPFTRGSTILVDEEFRDAVLRPEWWTRTDLAGAVTVSGGKLRVEGGPGIEGNTTVTFAEQLELGGALLLQHGDVSFTAASSGTIGGLYSGGLAQGDCIAGFRITPNGLESDITAVINGVPAGASITTVSGRRYVLTTRTYSRETYRRGQTFHSSLHPAGNGRGGDSVASEMRVVLEVHEIDPNDTASLIAPSTVLYDDVLSSAPSFCTYGLVNAVDLHCAITFTRLLRSTDAEVRSALPGQGYRTRLIGSLSDGAECRVTRDGQLWFFSARVPADGERIVVCYRGLGRAQTRLRDSQSIASEVRGNDDGVRGAVKAISAPSARTSEDCRHAVLALLDDATQTAWSGEYAAWSDFLPSGSSDVHPGDVLVINAPSQGAVLSAIVREVEIGITHLEDERSLYRMVFANEAAEALALALEPSGLYSIPDAVATDAVLELPASLASAEVTTVTSTDITVDTFSDAPAGGGFEVRWSDAGWGPDNDRNLLGRFTTRVFTLARLSRTQTYYLRAFDASAPPLYSRDSVVLHVAYPL